MAKDFMQKKEMIMKKIAQLKKANKSIHEIYKYTNDIILEEEDEDEEGEDSSDRTRSAMEVRGEGG